MMLKVMPAGPVFQAGTLSGNPIAMAAGIATLKELKKNSPYSRLDKLGADLERGLVQAAAKSGLPVRFNRIGSMWTLFFTETPVADFATAKMADTKRFGRFFWEMMDRGIYLPCSQFEAAFLSAPMTSDHIVQTVAAAGEAFQVISKG